MDQCFGYSRMMSRAVCLSPFGKLWKDIAQRYRAGDNRKLNNILVSMVYSRVKRIIDCPSSPLPCFPKSVNSLTLTTALTPPPLSSSLSAPKPKPTESLTTHIHFNSYTARKPLIRITRCYHVEPPSPETVRKSLALLFQTLRSLR